MKTPVLLLSYMRGRIPNINKLMTIVKKYNVVLIEDCAHAYGCLWDKKKLGSFGEISIISCQSNKLISTAEGGFILTSDDDLMACSLIASGCYENLYLKHEFLSPSENYINKYKFIIASLHREENIDYDKEDRVTSIARDGFLDGKIDWKKSDESIDK